MCPGLTRYRNLICEGCRKKSVNLMKNTISQILNRWIRHDRTVILVKAFYQNFILPLCNIMLKFLSGTHDLRKIPGNFLENSRKILKNIQESSRHLSLTPDPTPTPQLPLTHPHDPSFDVHTQNFKLNLLGMIFSSNSLLFPYTLHIFVYNVL